MTIKIGENIKRLRKAKNLTQEQLAELMNVSCAAVSKWESADTYPDITLIFPLANLFEVSVDELMGYDAARIENEIQNAIDSYAKLQYEGKYEEASRFISEARRKYPNDYRIMNIYMWNISGGSAENNPDVLNAHRDELLQICDCILNGCTDENIRLEGMTMKAKLLHASGDTAAALELLADFPTWYQSSGQKTEQLFAKDTPEFIYWVRRNLYELADFAADKMVKAIYFAPEISMEQKTEKAELLGDSLASVYSATGETSVCIMVKSIYGRLANDLTHRGGKIKDIIRIRAKYLSYVKILTELSRKDNMLHDLIKYEHNTENLLKWTVEYYMSTNNPRLAVLRENPEYMAAFQKYVEI